MGGAQAPRNGDYSVGAFADDVAAVADALQWNSFFLVGHSLGGFVSACCACRFPGRVPGLVFVDHGGDVRNDSREDLDALTRGLLPEHLEAFSREATETCLKGARPDVRDQVLADLRATPSAAFAGAILGLLDFDEPAALERYAGPKLHLYSDFLAAHQLTPIHALVPGCESSLVPDCSHWIHLDQPEVFNARVEAFLARCAAGSCR
jgi:pimeloyl-ACP methyl ester carboxylesterase